MSNRTTQRIGKYLVGTVLALGASLLTGCGAFFSAVGTGTTTTGGNGGDMVYVGKNGSNSIQGYQVSAGGLTQVTAASVTLGAPPTAMVVNPADTFLYVGTSNGIYGFSIASSGGLTALSSGALLASSIIPVSMDVSADGNWLIVLSNSLVNGIYIFPLNTSTGLFGTVTQYLTVPATGVPRAIKFSPAENTNTTSVVGAAFGSFGNYTYLFNSSTGVLTYESQNAYTSSGTSNSDNAIAFNANGTEMYVARGGSNTVIATYLINSSGAAANDVEYTSGNGPDAVTLSKAGTYVYAANLTDGTISGWTVGSTGNSTNPVLLTPLTASAPYSTLAAGPGAIAYDNSGNYILVFNQSSPPDLVQYTIDTSSTTAGRLYVSGSVTTGLINSVSVGSGVVMATTH